MKKIIANELLPGGMRRVKVISDGPIDKVLWEAAVPMDARGLVKFEELKDSALGIHTLAMEGPVCEPITFEFEPKPRKMLVWKVLDGQRVSEAIQQARTAFYCMTGFWPRLVFVKKLPQGADNGMMVHEVMLMQAEWALEGCVILGGRYDG